MGSFVRRCVGPALLCTLVVLIANGGGRAAAQSSDQAAQNDDINLQPGNGANFVGAPVTGAATSGSSPTSLTSISGNPAAVNIITGNGNLGKILGVNRNGWRLGGATINDANGILSGGLGPGLWAGQNLTLADVSFDADEAGCADGAMFGSEFLFYNGYGAGPTVNGIEQSQGSPNALAGSVMGFNSIDGKPPVNRVELYQLWYRQTLFDEKMVVRVGKSVPTYDFGNVTRPVRVAEATSNIPASSGAIMTPLYVNPTMLGVIPGYYNSATGIVISLLPTENVYLQYGFYDGNGATGSNTGNKGPQFTGHYFHIGEVGTHWIIGPDKKPGKFGIGYWGQTGPLVTFSNTIENGAQGVYLFGSQRLYWEQPGVNHNGLGAFYQFGSTNNDITFTQRYVGGGATYYGPLPGRDQDSAGFAMGWGRMTNDPNAGKAYFTGYGPGPQPLGEHEWNFTWYYQIQVRDGLFLQPNLTYIPDPARVPGTPGAFPLTIQAVMLF
jgi:porin